MKTNVYTFRKLLPKNLLATFILTFLLPTGATAQPTCSINADVGDRLSSLIETLNLTCMISADSFECPSEDDSELKQLYTQYNLDRIVAALGDRDYSVRSAASLELIDLLRGLDSETLRKVLNAIHCFSGVGADNSLEQYVRFLGALNREITSVVADSEDIRWCSFEDDPVVLDLADITQRDSYEQKICGDGWSILKWVDGYGSSSSIEDPVFGPSEALCEAYSELYDSKEHTLERLREKGLSLQKLKFEMSPSSYCLDVTLRDNGCNDYVFRAQVYGAICQPFKTPESTKSSSVTPVASPTPSPTPIPMPSPTFSPTPLPTRTPTPTPFR